MANRNTLDTWRGGASWSPAREFNRMQRRLDRFFDDFMASGLPTMYRTSFEPQAGFEEAYNPLCDIEESDSHYLVSFDLPGVKKEDVKLEIRDNQLIVSGERKEEQKRESGSLINIERYRGSFMRSFVLPASVSSENVEASYQDGVLQIVIPKSESSKAHQIPIKEELSISQGLLSKQKEGKPEKKTA